MKKDSPSHRRPRSGPDLTGSDTTASAEEAGGYSTMHHTPTVLVPIHIGGIDLSITAAVLWTFISVALVLVFGFLARRRVTRIPHRLSQNLFEITIEFVRSQILEPNELDTRRWTPLFLSVFLFIFFNDLANVIPGATSGSGNLNETFALAFVFFTLAVALRFKVHGPFGFWKSLIPSGVSGPVVALMFPIELVSQLFKPISLAVRLFANMSGGHALFLTIIAFAASATNAVVPVFSVFGGIVILLFELFVSFIQAYVFAFLSALMVAEAEQKH
ncbi:MAG TPA: F0F1 ATP synthase subunit A [Spirochaetota bacterium]|nr:F0F1 ATP synthase subunit A [Spirochaetota bacterium]